MKRKISDLLLLDDGDVYINLPTWELTKQFIIDAKEEKFQFSSVSHSHFDDPRFIYDPHKGIYDTGIYYIGCDLSILYTRYSCPSDLESKERKYYLIDYKDYLEGCDVEKCAHNIKGRSLSAGGFCVLVYSDSLKNFYGSSFYIELKNLGFLSYETHSDWSLGWVYVNLVDMVYTLRKPAEDQQCPPLGEHAVTISEFWTICEAFIKYRTGIHTFMADHYIFKKIHEIFEKYKGKDLFVFDKEPFDAPE